MISTRIFFEIICRRKNFFDCSNFVSSNYTFIYVIIYNSIFPSIEYYIYYEINVLIYRIIFYLKKITINNLKILIGTKFYATWRDLLESLYINLLTWFIISFLFIFSSINTSTADSYKV